jgi:phosphoribosyl 1,2-cyclic phosphate phosphodiesterase
VEEGETRLLVDAGPDFRQQMLRQRVKNLDAVLLTHEHADHIFGLDDIRSFNWIRKAPVDIYCEKRVADELRSIFKYAFAEKKYVGVPEMELIQIDETPFQIGGIEVIPIRLFHHKLPVYGFRFGKFAYLTDFNRIEPQESDKLKGVEVLVICALRKSIHVSHLCLAEALALAKEIGAGKTYLTHMSHEMGLHSVLAKELPSGVEPAWDGLVLEI